MAQERFEDLVEKLEGIVTQLENGELSLEDSLKAFKDGVDLVKRGSTRLNEMEKKVEILLKDVDADDAVSSFRLEEERSEGETGE